MTTKPTIELRKIRTFAGMSEETHCYTADLYVDGAKWGEVSNEGHGGPDNFHGIGGKNWADIKTLNERIAATYPQVECFGTMLTESLEMLCGGLVNDFLTDRDFTRAMGRKVMFIGSDKPGIRYYPVKKGFTFEQVAAHARAKHPTARLLVDMPRDEAKAAFVAS